MPPQMPMGMPGPGMMPMGPSKAERDAENRMVRLESWASMVMHTLITKKDFSMVSEKDYAADPSPYTRWVAKLSFSIAAAMETERTKLMRETPSEEGQDNQ